MPVISPTDFPVLATERLLLRAITAKDAESIYRLRTNKFTLQYLDKDPMQSMAEAVLLIKKITDDYLIHEGITWGIALKEQPAILIGTIGFWRIIQEHYRAEIGYMLLPDYFQKGYMKEAIRELLDYGFTHLKLHSVEANINPANQASEALLKSVGFIKEAYFKENFYFNGQFIDSAIYSLVKPGINNR
jgi:ribosomal-protein-alanine N-acetyltransferase